MKNTSTSPKRIAANRANSQKSTGPKTSHGRTLSKMNALKHGIFSRETVVRGRCIKENDHEFVTLHQRLWEDLKPVGPLEELLVDQIITAHWRCRRVLKAEAAEIVLSVDNGSWQRSQTQTQLLSLQWTASGNPERAMAASSRGNEIMAAQIRLVRDSVMQTGELTETAIQKVLFEGEPYGLTRELEAARVVLQTEFQANSEGLDPAVLRSKQKEAILAFLTEKMISLGLARADCEQREKKTEAAQQAAAVLPNSDVLDKIMRYETRLKRQLYRAMDRLEHVQQLRRGETTSSPSPKDPSEQL